VTDLEHVQNLINQGYANDLAEAWEFYNTTWHYLRGIIEDAAENDVSMTAQQFAIELLQEMGK